MYEILADRVVNGCSFNVDFKNRNLRVGKKYWIKNGEWNPNYSIDTNANLESIEQLYQIYKHSCPSERSEAKRNKYFMALPYEELDDAELVCGELREVVQFKLEYNVLCAILNGNLKWNDIWGTYFYQGNDPDFILLREWVEQ